MMGVMGRQSRKRRYRGTDIADGARLMREVLNALPAEEESGQDRAIRRRIEGAVVATEQIAGGSSQDDDELGPA